MFGENTPFTLPLSHAQLVPHGRAQAAPPSPLITALSIQLPPSSFVPARGAPVTYAGFTGCDPNARRKCSSGTGRSHAAPSPGAHHTVALDSKQLRPRPAPKRSNTVPGLFPGRHHHHQTARAAAQRSTLISSRQAGACVERRGYSGSGGWRRGRSGAGATAAHSIHSAKRSKHCAVGGGPSRPSPGEGEGEG